MSNRNDEGWSRSLYLILVLTLALHSTQTCFLLPPAEGAPFSPGFAESFLLSACFDTIDITFLLHLLTWRIPSLIFIDWLTSLFIYFKRFYFLNWVRESESERVSRGRGRGRGRESPHRLYLEHDAEPTCDPGLPPEPKPSVSRPATRPPRRPPSLTDGHNQPCFPGTSLFGHEETVLGSFRTLLDLDC